MPCQPSLCSGTVVRFPSILATAGWHWMSLSGSLLHSFDEVFNRFAVIPLAKNTSARDIHLQGPV